MNAAARGDRLAATGHDPAPVAFDRAQHRLVGLQDELVALGFDTVAINHYLRKVI